MNTSIVDNYLGWVEELCQLNTNIRKQTIIIAGPVNSGKSTLVNTLLGQDICPVEAAPSSFFPVYFNYSGTPSAAITNRGKTNKLPVSMAINQLKSKRKLSLPQSAVISLPSGTLKWCSLIDTPGIGYSKETDAEILELMSKADGILFLFHQRGIDTTTKHFLSQLTAKGIQGWISFWINTNTGNIDGTSLTETGQALKPLFPGKSEVYAINASERHSTDLLYSFLLYKVFEQNIRQIEDSLALQDEHMAKKIEKVSKINNDESFLIKYWEVFEEARTITSTWKALKELPLVYGSILNSLRSNTKRLALSHFTNAQNKPIDSIYTGTLGKAFEIIKEISSNQELSTFLDRLVLKAEIKKLEEKSQVMLTGPFSTGKTTFLNALLGEKLLPAEDKATTSCLVKLKYGTKKTAVVEYLYRAEFFPLRFEDGKYSINREEMLAVTEILEDPYLRSLISLCQTRQNGFYKKITLEQAIESLKLLNHYLNKTINISRIDDRATKVPLFSRRVNPSALPVAAIDSIRFTLGRVERQSFNLDDERQLIGFHRALTPPGSYLIDKVEIRHPSPNLKLAEFIDTPGLDSIHTRHLERTAATLKFGDMALVFLHAKHLLADGNQGHLDIIRQLTSQTPVFFVINFADTISEKEREKVSLYLRQKMARAGDSNKILPYPQVYVISALNALHKQDEGYERLMRRIRKKSEEQEQSKVFQSVELIKKSLESVIKYKEATEQARQTALHYLEELERLQKYYFK